MSIDTEPIHCPNCGALAGVEVSAPVEISLPLIDTTERINIEHMMRRAHEGIAQKWDTDGVLMALCWSMRIILDRMDARQKEPGNIKPVS